MAEGDEERTQAEVRHSRWPGWIWAIPLAALVIVTWLVIRHFAEEGPEVTVTFPTAEGVKPGTPVTYKGLEVGRVVGVELAHDLSHVTLTLRLNSDVEDGLREGTRFWIAGAKPDLSNPSTFKSILAGPTIAMDPGPGKRTDKFSGMVRPVEVPADTKGTRIVLHTRTAGAIRAGSVVRYLGLTVGKVENVALADNGQRFRITAFVRAPYDTFVRQGSKFWKDDGIEVSTGAAGVRAEMSSLSALLAGGIAFETSATLTGSPTIKNGHEFPLYDDKDAAHAAPMGPQIPFLVRFEGAVGGLGPGAPVRLRGFRVGQVTGVSLDYNARLGVLQTPVTIEIEPERLNISAISPPANGDWEPLVADAVDRLIHEGLRARIEESPPFIGGKIVVLEFEKGAPPARLIRTEAIPEIPSQPSGDSGDITARASAILTKIDNVPIDRIGREMERTASHLDSLVSSPQIKRSLDHLNRSLAHLDSITRSASGQIGPLIISLRRTADAAEQTVETAEAVVGGAGSEPERNIPEALQELSGAARAIRALANYLDEHPEALIEGRAEKVR